MPKKEKKKIVVRDRVDENICDLSLSELRDIPVSQIASFKRVNVLDLSSNRLTTLGKNFITLTRLVKLDLSKNQLKSLPEEFGLLHNLRHLDLYDNNLEYLPLSFGELVNLRYLDLKGNPLVPALLQIVGYCSTTKECHESARNTVKFMASMQIEAEKIKEQLNQQEQSNLYDEAVSSDQNINSDYNQNMHENQNMQTQQKSKRTSKKGKSKNSKTNNQNPSGASKPVQSPSVEVTNSSGTSGGGAGRSISTKNQRKGRPSQSTALSSILTFFTLLVLNVFIIYLVMFKNPEIAEFIVNIIPQQYRNWLAQKTEIFRLHVTDWISHFITPPDEN